MTRAAFTTRQALDALTAVLTEQLERDQNFRIRGQDGREAVLKIANADEDPAVVDLQAAALLHIEQVDPGMAVPRVLRTKAGESTTWVEDPDGARHLVRALTYLPGIPLGDVPRTPGLLRNLGAAVARLGLALRGFYHPAARHELLWDLQPWLRLSIGHWHKRLYTLRWCCPQHHTDQHRTQCSRLL